VAPAHWRIQHYRQRKLISSDFRTINSGNGESKVFDVKCDSDDIVVSLENGSIEVYDRFCLARRHSIEGHFTHGVHLGLHPNFIVTGFFDKVNGPNKLER
jgi:hypothetical protein